MICKNCGKEVNDNTAFCPECGAVVNPSANSGYEGGMVASTNLEGGMGAVPPPKKQKAPQNKKSSKSTIAIIILSALFVIAALVIVIILQNNKLNEKPDNKSRNTTGEMEFLSQQNYPAWNDEKPEIELTTTEVTHPVFDEPIEETTTSIEVVTNRDCEKVTNNRGEAVTEVVTQKPTTKPSTTRPQNQGSDVSSWSTDQILSFYNSATANVVSKKPGYTKTRSVTVGAYKAGAVLEAFKGEVFRFLCVGDANKFQEKVSKGTNTNDSVCGDYLRKSTLTTSDVSSAKIEKSGSNYIITIKVKGGTSYIEGGKKASNNSPIDKTGICAGATDRSGFDHKSAPLVYNALADIAPAAIISESTSNGKIVATVTPDGKIVKLIISWDASAKLSKIYGSTGDIAATTTVTYSNFGW